MKKFNVKMPFAGFVNLQVEANNKEEALKKFYEEYETLEKSDQYEWDFYEKISEGNVLYVPYHKVDIEEVDIEDIE